MSPKTHKKSSLKEKLTYGTFRPAFSSWLITTHSSSSTRNNAPQTGTIKVIYTAGKSIVPTQKSIYVSTNYKANPGVKLTVKANIVQLVEVTP